MSPSTSPTLTTDDRATLVAVEAEICALAGSMAAARARLLALIGRFDAAHGWVATGAVSAAHWLADLLDVEVSTAREKVRVARALRSLPLTSGRFEVGDLSYAKVRQLTRVATPDNEAELLSLARRHPAGALIRVLADWQRRHDPEAAARRGHDERGLTFRSVPSGNRLITIELAPERSAIIEARVDAEVMVAPAGCSEPGASLRQQRADAFMRLFEFTARFDASADASTGRTELVLHRRVGETTLPDGTPLPPSVARQLTCDADLRAMTHFDDGSPADVGRRHRLVTPRLRRLVFARDRGRCRYPGCTARHFLEVHHVIHWEDGGRTDLVNLTLRCSYHHRLSHRSADRCEGSVVRPGE